MPRSEIPSEFKHLSFCISITRVEHDSSGTSDPCLMVPPPIRGITPAPSKGTGIIPPAQSRAWGSARRNRRARTDEDGNKIATWYGKWGGRRTPPLEGSRSGARAFRRTGELCGIGWGEAHEGGQLGSVHSALLRARGRNAVGLLAGGGVRVARFAPWPGHVLRVHGYAAEAGQAVCDLSLPPQVERRHQFSEAICVQCHRSIPPGFVTR